jgi:hypothetical protein
MVNLKLAIVCWAGDWLLNSLDYCAFSCSLEFASKLLDVNTGIGDDGHKDAQSFVAITCQKCNPEIACAIRNIIRNTNTGAFSKDQ